MKREKMTRCFLDINKNRENEMIYEKMMDDMGISIIWYNEHEDLPNILKSLI